MNVNKPCSIFRSILPSAFAVFLMHLGAVNLSRWLWQCYWDTGDCGVTDQAEQDRQWRPLPYPHQFTAGHSARHWTQVVWIKVRLSLSLTPSTPAVLCCCSKGSVPYWSHPPFLIFDIRALWCSVL